MLNCLLFKISKIRYLQLSGEVSKHACVEFIFTTYKFSYRELKQVGLLGIVL